MNQILRKLTRDLPAMLGLGIVLFVLLIAILGPLLAPYPGDAAASHLARRLKPPSASSSVPAARWRSRSPWSRSPC